MNKMAQTTTVAEAEAYVKYLLKEKLSEDHHYHNLQHTLVVRDAALELARASNLSEEDLELLELAALFHDTGFTETYEGHEAISGQIAKRFLEEKNFPPEKMNKVLELIDATFPPKNPATLLEMIIRDADLSNLGREEYLNYLKGLRYEWATFLNKVYDDQEWYKLNYKFVKKHEYFTEVAKEKYGAQAKNNRKELKKLRDTYASPPKPSTMENTQKENQAASTTPVGYITGSKGAQMMFKTALRNHLDLSTLADNKANIMLSVNALIITIAMPLAASYVQSNIYILIPMVMLLATCLLSMIYATLATRPIKMMGYTQEEQIRSGKSNLFFLATFIKCPTTNMKGVCTLSLPRMKTSKGQ